MGQRRPRPVPSADARPAAGGARHDRPGDAGPRSAAEAAEYVEEVPGRHASSASSRSATSVETTCPWGNRIRVHAPEPEKFGPLRLGMPYVEFDVPAGTDLDGDRAFYTEILGGIAGVSKDERGPYAWASTSGDSKVIYRETDGSRCRIRRSPHPDHARRLLRPAQEAGGARADHRGERPAPVSLPRYRRCGHQQAAVPDRARDAQHASPDVQPDVSSTATRT